MNRDFSDKLTDRGMDKRRAILEKSGDDKFKTRRLGEMFTRVFFINE